MKIGFIGDIVGSTGRDMLKLHLKKLKDEHKLDFVIANYENASHGFGLTTKNAKELFEYGADAITGGNHTWDKDEISKIIEDPRILRPHNYPKEVGGSGCRIYDIKGEKLAVLNLLGHYSMPIVDNAFRCALDSVNTLIENGIKNIFIDFHAEASSEKRAMMMLLCGKVSAIIGTHTHISSDDFHISSGTAYLSDIGLTGCRDNVIGMDKEAPLKQFLTGVKNRFDISTNCKKILQMAILDLQDGKCTNAYKLKVFDDSRVFKTDAWIETI